MADKRQRDVVNLQTRGLKWVPDPEEMCCFKCSAEFSFVTRRVCFLLSSFFFNESVRAVKRMWREKKGTFFKKKKE